MTAIVRGFLYLVYLVIVGGLIAAIALTFHHDKVSAPSAPKVVHQINGPAAKAKSTPSGAATPAPTPAPTPSSSGASSSSTPSQPSTQAAPNLTNTGPGNLVAVFFGACLSGVMVARRYLTRHVRNS